jgi:thioesterase domain-containing protein
MRLLAVEHGAIAAGSVGTIEDMARATIAGLTSLKTPIRGPITIVGHSGGSHIAWEVACQLLDLGHKVETFINLDGPPIGYVAPAKSSRPALHEDAVRAAEGVIGRLLAERYDHMNIVVDLLGTYVPRPANIRQVYVHATTHSAFASLWSFDAAITSWRSVCRRTSVVEIDDSHVTLFSNPVVASLLDAVLAGLKFDV